MTEHGPWSQTAHRTPGIPDPLENKAQSNTKQGPSADVYPTSVREGTTHGPRLRNALCV